MSVRWPHCDHVMISCVDWESSSALKDRDQVVKVHVFHLHWRCCVSLLDEKLATFEYRFLWWLSHLWLLLVQIKSQLHAYSDLVTIWSHSRSTPTLTRAYHTMFIHIQIPSIHPRLRHLGWHSTTDKTNQSPWRICWTSKKINSHSTCFYTSLVKPDWTVPDIYVLWWLGVCKNETKTFWKMETTNCAFLMHWVLNFLG